MQTIKINIRKTRLLSQNCFFHILATGFFCYLTIANVNAAEPCTISGSGIGGTGIVASGNSSGIGGTGVIANGSGIGGTGITAQVQTGIVTGTITGFGSICVNGIEIHYDTTTPLLDLGNTVLSDTLSIGEVVVAKVASSDGRATASEIQRMYAVKGPVSDVLLEGKRIKILGQLVTITAKTHFAGFKNRREFEAQIHSDDSVVVSGLRKSGGDIIASRIEKIPAPLTTSVIGPVTEVTADGFQIYGINVETKHADTITSGQQVYVSGQSDGDTLKADQVIPTSNLQMPSAGEFVIIEGYIHNLLGVSQLDIGGRTVELPAQLLKETTELNLDQRIVVQGLVAPDKVIRADYLIIETGVDEISENTSQQLNQKDTAKKPVREISSEQSNTLPEENKQSNDAFSLPGDSELQNSERSKNNDLVTLPEVKRINSPHVIEASPVELAPKIDIPQNEILDTRPPEIVPGDISVPAVDIREVEVPDVDIPVVNIPEVNIPQIEIPSIDVPVIDTPRVDVPEVQVIEVDVPEVKMSR